MSTPGTNIPTDRLMDVYKIIFDTWRSQVDSSWQRSSYFAAFEIAAIGGCWFLVSGRKIFQAGSGLAFSFGGLILTVIWHLSTKKTQTYVRHWWDSIRAIEKALALSPYDFAQQLESQQENAAGVKYQMLVRWIPILFGSAWILLFLIAAVRLLCLCTR